MAFITNYPELNVGTLDATGNINVGNATIGSDDGALTLSNSSVATLEVTSQLTVANIASDGNISFNSNGVVNIIKVHGNTDANSDISFFANATAIRFWNSAGTPYIGANTGTGVPRIVLGDNELQITTDDLDRGLVLDNQARITIETTEDANSANANVGALRVFGGVSVEKSMYAGNIATPGSLTTSSMSATGNVALSGANVSLGAVGNLHITGGSNNQILKTDGSGNLTWANSVSSSTTIANDASPSALPLVNQVQILSYDAGNIEYTLADGYEGQLMHFVATPSDVYYPWSINILCKGRYINANTEVVTANGNWYPWLTGYNNFIFSSYAIFAGNAWNFGSGEFTPT